MAAFGAEKTVRDLLKEADIEVYGQRPWDIQVKDSRFYERVLSQASLGLGESYVEGWWEVESIDGLVERMLRAALEKKVKGNLAPPFRRCSGGSPTGNRGHAPTRSAANITTWATTCIPPCWTSV